MSKTVLLQAKTEYPIIFQKFTEQVGKYNDFDFKFRYKMVQNVPYFRQVEDYIIYELVNYLKPKRYEAGTLIVTRGDMIDEIFLLKSGSIIVEVPIEDEKNLYLDWLNEGSCFCIYSALNDQQYQMVSFRASSTCIVESISVKDLYMLQKSHI